MKANTPFSVPTTSADFDRFYRLPITPWGDRRIPPELKALAQQGTPRSSLELGCGIGRFSRYLVSQGICATAVDFSAVAIEKARRRVAADSVKPTFLVGDVTQLEGVEGPFDFSFDVGCFHCLDAKGMQAYVAELHRLLRPGGIHLIWAMDASPSGIRLSADYMKGLFKPKLYLQNAQQRRRRLTASHWYWLVRAEGQKA
jgi:SAM-dependent methyltransferase